MRTLKISPSLLDQYRSVRLGEYGKTAEDLSEYILGEFVTNEAVSRGTAYHEMIEHGPGKYTWYDQAKGQHCYAVHEEELDKTWFFSPEAVKPIIELRKKYDGLVYESWNTMWMESQGLRIRVRMRYDGMLGLRAKEFKTTGRKKKSDDYRKTVQWKMYLLASPELQGIDYHVFVLNKNNTKCTPLEFSFEPYPEMKADVQELLDGLVGWLQLNPHLLDKLTIEHKETKDIF